MTHTPLRARGQRGQVLPVLAVTMVAIVAACALAVDVAGALRLHAAEAQTLELAKESSMSSLNAQKFASDPAEAAYQLAADALVADGFEGTATIWYYEVPQAQMPVGRRAIDRMSVTAVEVTRTYASAFAGIAFGRPTLGVRDSIVWTSNPYSTTRVWRPSTTPPSRAYDITIRDGTVRSKTSRSITRSTLPAAARDAIDSAVASLSGRH